MPDNNYVGEFYAAILERTIKRLWIAILVLIIALIGTNAAWIYYESQWQVVDTTTTITQDLTADNGNAVINDGVHINGESNTDSSDQK